MPFDAAECASALSALLSTWNTVFKFSVQYIGSSLDEQQLSPEERAEREPEFIKFLTAWTYETELQPVAARAINVEFTVFNPAMDFMDVASFRFEHEDYVYRISSNHPRDQSIDYLLLRALNLKRRIESIWPTDTSTLLFFAARKSSKRLDEERKVERHLLPHQSDIDHYFAHPDHLNGSDSASKLSSALHQAGLGRPQRAELEAKLVRMFRDADVDGSGYLDRHEFRELLLASDLGLREEDIPLLLASVDEDTNGRISYSEFVAVGLEVMEVIQIRRQAHEQVHAELQQAQSEAFSLMHGLTDQEIQHLFEQELEQHGISHDSFVSRNDLRTLLSNLPMNLTKIEINSIMARIPDDGVAVAEFHDRFPFVLKEIMANAVLMRDASDLEVYLVDKFKALDVHKKGSLSTQQLREVLLNLHKITLTRLQVYAILAEAQLDPVDGLVPYIRFAKTASSMITQMFEPARLAVRKELLFRSGVTPIELLNGIDKAALEESLRIKFLEHDSNGNGTLSLDEFRRCLESTALGLSTKQIMALMNVADVDASGGIDYSEFVRFAYDVLLSVAREAALQQMVEAQQNALDTVNEEEDGVVQDDEKPLE